MQLKLKDGGERGGDRFRIRGKMQRYWHGRELGRRKVQKCY